MNRVPWTTEDEQVVRDRYPHEPTAIVAEAIGRSICEVYRKAAGIGLRKTEAYFATPAACRLRNGDKIGVSTRFQKGHTTWNKGMKGLDIGGKETRFKPGHRGGKAAQLYKPIGTERISKDGYLERKINDDMPLQKRWRAVHLLVWESVNGPLPAGHAVTFKDGNKRNVSLENLALISRADLMRRNTIHNYGPEIAELNLMRARLVRQINRSCKNV